MRSVAVLGAGLAGLSAARALRGAGLTGEVTVAGTVTLRSGRTVHGDGFVVATGARARTLPGADALAGVQTLRTLPVAVLGVDLVGPFAKWRRQLEKELT